MLSVFGIKPTKAKYNSTLESNLEFLDNKKYKSKNIFKDEIIEKLKLLSLNDLLHCKQTTFNLLLSLPIEEIKKYILYTTNKLVKITNGLKSSFTKSQFNTFINNNESLKVFESCYNNYDFKFVNKSLKSNFNAKSLLSTHRMDLLEHIFNPTSLLDSEITEKIYESLFPDSDHRYIDEQFSRINKSIPKTPITDALMKQYKQKIRVFFIQGHAMACTVKEYAKKDRLNYEKVFANIKDMQQKEYIRTHASQIHRYNINQLNIVSTQQVGRKSIFTIIELLNKILSSKYRNTFLQGLINANKLEQLRILENIVNMYWNYYCIKNRYSTSDEELSPYLKKSKLKHTKLSNTSRMYSFPKTFLTTTDIVNFVKYKYTYPPINTQFYFEPQSPLEGLHGIFELNEENADDFIKLNNKIISVQKKDSQLNLGLKLNEVYEFRGDVPEKADEILKYNKALKPKSRPTCRGPPCPNPYMYTLEEIIAHIYLEGDIKPDEHVVIFNNSCRGINHVGKHSMSSNTFQDLKQISKLQMQLFRATSIEDSLGEELEGTNI